MGEERIFVSNSTTSSLCKCQNLSWPLLSILHSDVLVIDDEMNNVVLVIGYCLHSNRYCHLDLHFP